MQLSKNEQILFSFKSKWTSFKSYISEHWNQGDCFFEVSLLSLPVGNTDVDAKFTSGETTLLMCCMIKDRSEASCFNRKYTVQTTIKGWSHANEINLYTSVTTFEQQKIMLGELIPTCISFANLKLVSNCKNIFITYSERKIHLLVCHLFGISTQTTCKKSPKKD